MIIYARSPFFVTVPITVGYGSKLELYISNGTGTVPTTPTYTIVKDYYNGGGSYQNYNISNYIREYIENVSYSSDPDENFAKVNVKYYRQNSDGSYTLLATLGYLATNGYTLYTQGANYTDPSGQCVLLTNPNINVYYYVGAGVTPSINVLVDSFAGSKLETIFTDLNGNHSVTNTIISTSAPAQKSIVNVPLTDIFDLDYQFGSYCRIRYTQGAETHVDKTIKVIPICEPKYTPVRCYFINRFGGWQTLTFFKSQSNSINVTGTSYNKLSDSINYYPRSPQTGLFNVNGRQSIKLNTGWVPENYSELIQDLLLSETVLLGDKPVQVRTQGTELKTSLKDKNINYEIEFEYAYNLINNVV
jgi:hypothetical protein